MVQDQRDEFRMMQRIANRPVSSENVQVVEINSDNLTQLLHLIRTKSVVSAIYNEA